VRVDFAQRKMPEHVLEGVVVGLLESRDRKNQGPGVRALEITVHEHGDGSGIRSANVVVFENVETHAGISFEQGLSGRTGRVKALP
jgi:hypothetical protein